MNAEGMSYEVCKGNDQGLPANSGDGKDMRTARDSGVCHERQGFAEVSMLTEKIKYWFGDGEIDVDLMIRMGAVTEKQILDMWEKDPTGFRLNAD